MTPDALPLLLACPFCGGPADYKAAALHLPGDVIPINPWAECLACGCRTGSAVSSGDRSWRDNFTEGVALVSSKWNARRSEAVPRDVAAVPT